MLLKDFWKSGCSAVLLLALAASPVCAEATDKAEDSASEPEAGSGVIARVGDQAITYGELSTMLNSSAMVGLSVPALGTPERNKVMITLLDKAISANLLYLDGKAAGTDKAEPYTSDLQRFEKAILASLYESKVLIGDLPVSEDEVQSFYASSISPQTELDEDVKLAIEAKLRKQKLEALRATQRERLREGVTGGDRCGGAESGRGYAVGGRGGGEAG
jgi:hypothetical protein